MGGARQPDEFSLIEALFAPLAAKAPGALGLRDDAALVEVPAGHRLVVTADAIVAGVHFLPQDPPDLVARKLVRVNLSDLAAMGAAPVGIVITAAFSRDAGMDWIERFAAGLAADLEEFDVPLLGGDTVATPGPATFSATALGTAKRGHELRRAGARAGDGIFVSGTIGDAALGLAALQGRLGGLEARDLDVLAERYRLPRPRTRLGPGLAGVASACIDVSDGLCADLGHICAESGVAAEVEIDRVPLSPAAREAMAVAPDGLAAVLCGGDDYELLFTVPPGREGELERLSRSLDLALTRIGRVVVGSSARFVKGDGTTFDPGPGGYRHFPGGGA